MFLTINNKYTIRLSGKAWTTFAMDDSHHPCTFLAPDPNDWQDLVSCQGFWKSKPNHYSAQSRWVCSTLLPASHRLLFQVCSLSRLLDSVGSLAPTHCQQLRQPVILSEFQYVGGTNWAQFTAELTQLHRIF